LSSLQQELIALLPRLRRLARALTRDPTNADDLVQITLERALSRAGQFRTGHSLDRWVFGILRNAWLDDLRSRRRWARVVDGEADGAEAADAASGPPLEAIALRDAIARLPPDQRLAVALVLVEGYSYREAAEVANVPEGTLTSRVARGRAALLAELNGGEADHDR
jgi:RNA polymerase sigma-70 factor, ECF subfamily